VTAVVTGIRGDVRWVCSDRGMVLRPAVASHASVRQSRADGGAKLFVVVCARRGRRARNVYDERPSRIRCGCTPNWDRFLPFDGG